MRSGGARMVHEVRSSWGRTARISRSKLRLVTRPKGRERRLGVLTEVAWGGVWGGAGEGVERGWGGVRRWEGRGGGSRGLKTSGAFKKYSHAQHGNSPRRGNARICVRESSQKASLAELENAVCTC